MRGTHHIVFRDRDATYPLHAAVRACESEGLEIMARLSDAARWRLCLGCGMCRFLAGDDRLRLIDVPEEGIRPVVFTDDPAESAVFFRACPVSPESVESRIDPCKSYVGDLTVGFGPVRSIFEGHAIDPEIRYRGASGGLLTALSLFCLERLGMGGVLHLGQDPQDAVRNRTRLSRTRDELLAAAGSRYAPGSVCDGLHWVRESSSPCVFIGRPVEAVALAKARRLLPELDAKVGLVLSFFCAEAPSTRGTLELLHRAGLDPACVAELRYRGHGWPGEFAARLKGTQAAAVRMTYRESWAFLQAYRPWSAHLWPDGTGEAADIACGDPWYEEPDGVNPGFSLVVARTPRGEAILREAVGAGYLHLQPAEPWKLVRSQQGLVSKKGAVWGRLLAMSLFGIPVPPYPEYHLFESWRRLPLEEKLRSTLGTARRVISRGYWKPLSLPHNFPS